MRKFLQWVLDRVPTKAYRVDGEDLFYRGYLFQFCGWVFYLHHYLRSDPDRGQHNHPFKAVALVLSGGYTEERIAGFNENGFELIEKRIGPGCINKIDQHCFHKLRIDPVYVDKYQSYLYPTSWSLFVCKYIPAQTWGFIRKYDSINPDIAHTFLFTKAGISSEKGWWKTAPKGKYVAKVR